MTSLVPVQGDPFAAQPPPDPRLTAVPGNPFAPGAVAAPRGDRLMPSNGADAAPASVPDTVWAPWQNSPLAIGAAGAADAASLGFGDEIGAGIGAALGDQPKSGSLLGDIRQANAGAQAANPGAYFGGQVVGSVLPMLAAGPEIKGATLPFTAFKSALAGGAFGGAYGVGSGDTPSGRLTGGLLGAGVGGTLGGAVPFAGRGVSSGLSLFGGSPSKAVTAFGRAANADGFPDAQTLTQALTGLGPDAMPVDLGINLQSQGGGLVAQPGTAASTLSDALTGRQAGANSRIRTTVDSVLGPAPVPSQVAATIKTNQLALQPAYRAVLANAKAVDTTSLANDLTSQVANLRGGAQKAVVAVRNMLNVPGTDQLDPHPGALLATRQAIDGMLATEADPNTIRVLTAARSQVDQALTKAAPGIKAVDGMYAELASQGEAFKTGQATLNDTTHPQDLTSQMAAGASPKGTAVGPSAVPFMLSQGARASIDKIIGTNSNDVVALNKMIKGDGSWNRDKLATLFGPDKADQIIGLVDRERQFAGTYGDVVKNSKTAARTAAQAEISNPTSTQPSVVTSTINAINPLNFKPGSAAARVGNWLIGSHAKANQMASNAELADLLTMHPPQPGQPDVLANALNLASQQRARQAAIEAGTNMALRPVAQAVTANGKKVYQTLSGALTGLPGSL